MTEEEENPQISQISQILSWWIRRVLWSLEVIEPQGAG